MKKSLCGADCKSCPMNSTCCGCAESCGKPFGEKCMIAKCFEESEEKFTQLKERIIEEFNSLNINDMDKVTELFALRGVFVNMEYTLPNGEKVKFLNDNKIYLGNQLKKNNSDRCYGIAADEKYLLVSEYEQDGIDAELIIYKQLKK